MADKKDTVGTAACDKSHIRTRFDAGEPNLWLLQVSQFYGEHYYQKPCLTPVENKLRFVLDIIP
jgi:hypothetical protein